MTHNIEAIFLDLGNTLRILVKDQDYMAQARQKIVELVGTDEDPAVFVARLDERYKIYRKWAFENLREAPESEMWTRWLVPDFPAEKIAPLGGELTYQFRQSMGRRVVVDGGREVVEELQKRGYILGIISNLIGTREIPEWLEIEDFAPYFKAVALSSVLGIRKPDPAIYLEAARLAGVDPSHCVYVGDNLKRDVTGTRAAEFGMVIIMISLDELVEATITDENRPDLIIHQFKELLDIFPAITPSPHPLSLRERGCGEGKEQPMLTNKIAHGAITLGNAVRQLYTEGQTDYSLEPIVLTNAQGEPMGRIKDGDSVIFCCRRGEREIELTEAFTESDFDRFSRPDLGNLRFVILTLYHEKFKDLPVAFAPTRITDTLSGVISKAGLNQLHTAESEKFAHVTFFFNGGNNQPFAKEDDVRVPSPKGIPFDQVPELSLPQVTEEVLRGIEKKYDFIITNFANGDVIGHTSNNDAKIKCASVVDAYLGRVVDSALANDYVVFVTADHGNLEEIMNPDGTPHVAHTTNPVKFILLDPRLKSHLSLRDGKLADVAPMVLSALGLTQPEAMTGVSLTPHYDWGGRRRVLLVILDGWGIGREDDANPIFLAHTPRWDDLLHRYPNSKLEASGEAVGLKDGKTGNSEAGHMNVGAGRVVVQDDVRLDMAMQDGSFYTNEVFLQTIREVKQHGKNLHLIGLLTEKSSHGSIDYLLALLRMAKEHGLDQVYLHMIFDGRSTEPGSAPALLEKLECQIEEIGIGNVVSGVGRGIALDRDGNYAKIQHAFDALVSGKGKHYAID